MQRHVLLCGHVYGNLRYFTTSLCDYVCMYLDLSWFITPYTCTYMIPRAHQPCTLALRTLLEQGYVLLVEFGGAPATVTQRDVQRRPGQWKQDVIWRLHQIGQLRLAKTKPKKSGYCNSYSYWFKFLRRGDQTHTEAVVPNECSVSFDSHVLRC